MIFKGRKMQNIVKLSLMKNNITPWKQAFYKVISRIPFFIMVIVPISYFGLFNIGAYFCGKTEALSVIGKNNGKSELTLVSNANDTMTYTTGNAYKINIGDSLYLKTVTFNYPFHYHKERIQFIRDSAYGLYVTFTVILGFIYILFEPFLEILAKKIVEKIKR